MASFGRFLQIGLALDPIHVGAGGARIGRVDLTIVRDPVTRIPKIPGSSLAGVYRTYVAMHFEEDRQQRGRAGEQVRQKPFYPDCAGLGIDENHGHCRQPDCSVCTVFGFARGSDQEGGFAGLAAFTDAHVLLFPVPTRRGPMWVTSPMALRLVSIEVAGVDDNAVYLRDGSSNQLNLGWLLLPVQEYAEISTITEPLQHLNIPDYILNRLALVPDRLFAHIVNSNLEVRTSVSINPETGAAEDKALFSYEALPRGTLLVWEIIAKNPQHFRISGQSITAVSSPNDVYEKAKQAHPYLKHLGIGGMGTRGMGRVEVVYPSEPAESQDTNCGESPQEQQNSPGSSEQNEEASHE